jgi:hypothetical protein
MMKNDVGFYVVNGKPFSNKFEAVLEAQKTNAVVKWDFFDSDFEKVDWYTEPSLSLDDFYRIRAEQIRNAYDYVIVFCSGGADSTNVIKTFINNGIRVDEVIGLAPMSGLKNWDFDPNNVSDLNIISETQFALIPLFQELSTTGIKLTIYDFFEDITKYKDESWTFDSCGNIVTALTSHFTNVCNIPHIRKIVDSGKRVALVYGTDKPVVKILQNGDMSFSFGDGGVNYLNMPDSRSFPNVDRVLFYWTKDLPEMLVKQAHVVGRLVQTPQFKEIYEKEILVSQKDILHNTRTYQDVLDDRTANNMPIASRDDLFKKHTAIKSQYQVKENITSYRTIYQRAIVPYIYPSTYKPNLWQSQKIEITEGFFTRDQDWVHVLHAGSRVSDMILAGTKMLYYSISNRYLNPFGTGFRPIVKSYKFGNIHDNKTNTS